MSKCEHRGNKYDKTSEVRATVKRTSSRFTPWRRNAIAATARSLGMVSKPAGKCFVARIARESRESGLRDGS